MVIIRQLFWVVVFLASTLSFVVIFEKGTTNFGANLGKEIGEFRQFVESQIHPKKDATATATPSVH